MLLAVASSTFLTTKDSRNSSYLTRPPWLRGTDLSSSSIYIKHSVNTKIRNPGIMRGADLDRSDGALKQSVHGIEALAELCDNKSLSRKKKGGGEEATKGRKVPCSSTRRSLSGSMERHMLRSCTRALRIVSKIFCITAYFEMVESGLHCQIRLEYISKVLLGGRRPWYPRVDRKPS